MSRTSRVVFAGRFEQTVRGKDTAIVSLPASFRDTLKAYSGGVTQRLLAFPTEDSVACVPVPAHQPAHLKPLSLLHDMCEHSGAIKASADIGKSVHPDFAGAVAVIEVDAKGRMALTDDFVQMIRPESNPVVFVGGGDHFEVLATMTYQEGLMEFGELEDAM
jgi:DNA-binding transcriptional regulator/RsmH inhibitor MraZ